MALDTLDTLPDFFLICFRASPGRSRPTNLPFSTLPGLATDGSRASQLPSAGHTVSVVLLLAFLGRLLNCRPKALPRFRST